MFNSSFGLLVLVAACSPDDRGFESSRSEDTDVTSTTEGDQSLTIIGGIPGISGIRMSGDESRAAVLNDRDDVVVVVDVENLTIDRTIAIPQGKSLDVAMGDGLVFVPFEILGVDEDGGVAIFEGGDMIGWIPCVHAHHILYRDGLLYITVHHSIEIWDVADPTSPVMVGSWTGEGTKPHGIFLQGTTLFAGAWAGLGVLDVTDPTNPKQIGWGASLTQVHSVAVMGDIAYTTDENEDGWLRSWNVSNLEQPMEISQLYANSHSDIYPMAVLDDRLYVAAYEEGLLAFDEGGSVPDGGSTCDACSTATEPPTGVNLVWAGQDRIVILEGDEVLVLKQGGSE